MGDYLREEVAAEGLARRLPAFTEFLLVAALADGGMVNFSTIARDCGVPVSEGHGVLPHPGGDAPGTLRALVYPAAEAPVIRASKLNALTLARNRCSPWRNPAWGGSPHGVGRSRIHVVGLSSPLAEREVRHP